MFPIDFWFNTLKVEVTVTFNVDSQYVSLVRSVTKVWFGPVFPNFIQIWSYRVDVPYRFWVQHVKGQSHSDLQLR